MAFVNGSASINISKTSCGKNIRIIPRLDIKGQNVVKPVQTEALRVVGNPKKLASKYYKQGADEIIYMDIVASLYRRNIDLDLLREVSENIFIPLTVGGGIRSIGDISNVLRAGADKVAINTYATSNPQFLQEAVEMFGAQCIVLSVDAKKQANGKYEAYTDGGREKSGREVVSWVKEAIRMGIGEVLVASVDREGTRKGYDLDLVSRITSFAPIPVIAHSGAGKLESIYEVVDKAHADAVSASSIFQYNDYKISEVKKFLDKKGVAVRL